MRVHSLARRFLISVGLMAVAVTLVGSVAAYLAFKHELESRQITALGDYVFERTDAVISPPARSGSLVEFSIRRNRAIVGRLVSSYAGNETPMEFREIRLVRAGTTIGGFTARRGEFYFETVEPGEYELRADNGTGCSARVVVPKLDAAVTDVGTVVCTPVRH